MVFIPASLLSLSWARSNQSPSSQPVSRIHFNIVLPSTSTFPNGLFPSCFPTNSLDTPLLFSIHATRLALLILLYVITRMMFGVDYKSCSFWLCSFLQFPVSVSPLITNTHSIPSAGLLSLSSDICNFVLWMCCAYSTQRITPEISTEATKQDVPSVYRL